MTLEVPLPVSLWSVARPAAVGVCVALGLLVIQYVHLYWVVTWGNQKTLGLRYFGRPLAGRRRFRRVLYYHRLMLTPTLWLVSRLSHLQFSRVTFSFRGVAGPKGTCTPESFGRAAEYEPRPDDVFVATQMKCGTTWMQHVVYQVLTRGSGDLVETGTALCTVSPWIESVRSVPVGDAPRVGAERPSRIIKTHFPVSLCPYRAEAKYIYVARHPLSCLASCRDFVAANLGSFRVSWDELEAWFRSEDLMWWSTWPSHVRGWWRWSQERENVHFVTFEEMKRDLPATIRQVAQFLQIRALREEEIDQIVRKCRFDYMQAHAEAFEMSPPHVLQSRPALFVSGRVERHRDVPEAVRQRILAWCKSELDESGFPLKRYYPDVAEIRSPR